MCNETPFTVEKLPPPSGDRTRSARSVGQRLTHCAIGAPPEDLNMQYDTCTIFYIVSVFTKKPYSKPLERNVVNIPITTSSYMM